MRDAGRTVPSPGRAYIDRGRRRHSDSTPPTYPRSPDLPAAPPRVVGKSPANAVCGGRTPFTAKIEFDIIIIISPSLPLSLSLSYPNILFLSPFFSGVSLLLSSNSLYLEGYLLVIGWTKCLSNQSLRWHRSLSLSLLLFPSDPIIATLHTTTSMEPCSGYLSSQLGKLTFSSR